MLAAMQVESVLGDRTRVIGSLAAAHNEARTVVDSRLLEVCERRVSELLGVQSAEEPASRIIAANDVEQAVLAFVEQWVIDVASMTDELVAPLQAQLGDDGLQDLVHGLLVVEQRVRLSLAWEQLGLLA